MLHTIQRDNGYTIERDAKPLSTPKKHQLIVPTAPLAEALADEWRGQQQFSPKKMPLTAMTFAAIDIIPEHNDKMVEALLAYAETDLLFYRSETPELRQRQERGWNPVLAWARGRYDCEINITEGVMPLSQPEATMERLHRVLAALPPFSLSAFTVLTQSLGSLMLALAVSEKWLTSQEAFKFSRIDEDFQAEKWGEDSIALGRAQELARDIAAAERFLELLAS